MLNSLRLYFLAIFIICIQLVGCQSYSNMKDKVLTAITLANGEIVTNCADYNSVRSTHMIAKTVNNMMIASEYLPCSLANTAELAVDEANLIGQQLLTMRVRQIPLSIAQLYSRKTSLSDSGFELKNDTLEWYGEQHSIIVQVKAKANDVDNRYLIWISDLITDGNYYAYYPAWIDVTFAPTTIKVLPIYQSDF
jgi:hypothetical protein